MLLKVFTLQFNLVPHSPEHHIQEQDNWQCKPEHPSPYLPAINNCTIEDLSMLDTFPTLSSTISADQHWMLKRKENWRRHGYWGWPDSNLVVWNSPELRSWLFQWLQRWETVHPFNSYLQNRSTHLYVKFNGLWCLRSFEHHILRKK